MSDQGRLCIVPARGGSKRLPAKNIRMFHGLPMIGHSLKTAAASRLFSMIHVSTESDQIASVAAGMGFEPEFRRPPELAGDHVPLMPVLKHAVEEYAKRGSHFGTVCLLMACAPLIEPEDLIEANALFESGQRSRPVMSIAPYPVPVEWAYRRAPDGLLIPREPGMFAVRSQDLEAHYFDAGCFYFFPVAHILGSTGAGSDSQFMGHSLPKHRALDIDDAEDWAMAEALYRKDVSR